MRSSRLTLSQHCRGLRSTSCSPVYSDISIDPYDLFYTTEYSPTNTPRYIIYSLFHAILLLSQVHLLMLRRIPPLLQSRHCHRWDGISPCLPRLSKLSPYISALRLRLSSSLRHAPRSFEHRYRLLLSFPVTSTHTVPTLLSVDSFVFTSFHHKIKSSHVRSDEIKWDQIKTC